MAEYTVVVCTKDKRSLRNRNSSMRWRSVCLKAMDEADALSKCYNAYGMNHQVRFYMGIYRRNSDGFARILGGEGDAYLRDELHDFFSLSIVEPYFGDFPWDRDDYTGPIQTTHTWERGKDHDRVQGSCLHQGESQCTEP